MANHGVGNKFLSVNLNKSYGQSSTHHHQHHYHGSYGSNRGGRTSGGGGGGMVVLSRPRSSQKSGPKLSVPPPLNLPSLRKEHERFDSSGSGAGTTGGGISGSGSRPTSSGMGWSKPGTVALQEKEGFVDDHVGGGVDHGFNIGDEVSKGGNGVYMPPSARSGVVGPSASASSPSFPQFEKATVLRGEDFPTLQAALPVVSGTEKKQKDSLNLKQKQLAAEELSSEKRASSRSSLLVEMRPQLGHNSIGNELGGSGGQGHGLSASRASEPAQKQEDYFPGPLPLVRLNPRSDWADDERDTGHGLTDRGRDHGYSKGEAYWDRDFDMPRVSLLPHKSAHSLVDRWGQRDNETGRNSSSEVTNSRDVRTPSREGQEGNSWRASSPLSKEGFSSQAIGNDRNFIDVRPTLNREKDSKYVQSHFHDNAQDDIGKRDLGYGRGGKQPWNNTIDTFSSRMSERNTRERFGSEQNNRYKGDIFQNGSSSKSSFSLGSRGLSVNDPILNFGREKRPFSKNEKPYVEDSFLKDFGPTSFDGQDPFSTNLVGVVKRKKDVLKQTDLHDPVREAFEAELERVQKKQEQERQRIMEEQERALELARREEEERLRLAREQEELKRRLEEEAREAAWRAEQERLESVRRVEEQRIAREEEKRRILMEEERRKQAAKQKLLELEEKIAKRQAEVSKSGDNSSAVGEERISEVVKGRDVSKAADVGDWEDGERMVERITTSASSDSSGLSRPFETSSRTHFSRDVSSVFSDRGSVFSGRGKNFNAWRRDVFENGNSSTFIQQDNETGHHSPRQDGSAVGRPFPRKEHNGGAGFASSRAYYRAGNPEHHMEEFSNSKGQRWNIPGDGDHFGRNAGIESEYHENLLENYSDISWGQHSRSNPYPPYPERFYQNPEGEGVSSFGRSRYSMRQPRVLPPPSLSSMQKTSYRGDGELSGPSNFQQNEMQYSHPIRSGSTIEAGCDSVHQDLIGRLGIINAQQENTENELQKLDGDTARCASQSSLSVSSPPDSPVHLSQDDLDESGDSIILSSGEGKDVAVSGLGNDSLVLPSEAGKENMFTASNSISAGEDDEWNIDSNEQLQEQEEYDEDEDGYQEEDEVHEGDGGNIVLTRDFDSMHLEEKEASDIMENLVLGFNEGVEVGLPNDELERSSRTENAAFALLQDSVGTVEEKESFNGMHAGQTLESMDAPHVNLDSSARILQETDEAMQDLVIQPSDIHQISPAPELVDHVDASSSAVSASHAVRSSDHTAMSTASSLQNHGETPVKLPFGLFSGPSLIPSPVPAIQIGSIQMPLHLHPQVSPSLTHMHPSQPSLFQFGQLRYTSPISQGVLPLAPQSMSFVQPNVPNNFSLNQGAGAPLPIRQAQEASSHNLLKTEVPSLLGNQSSLGSRSLDLSHGTVSNEQNSLPARESGKTVVTQQGQLEISNVDGGSASVESGFLLQDQGNQNSVVRNFKSLSNKESEVQLQTVPVASQSVPKEKDSSGSRAHGQIYGSRGKKYVFTVKNANLSSFQSSEASSRQDSSGYQRRAQRLRSEFRIRETADKKQAAGIVSSDQSNHLGPDDKSNANGRGAGYSTRNGVRKALVLNKSKQSIESEGSGSGPVSSREIYSGNRAEKTAGKELSIKSQNIPHSGEGSLKRNIEDDVDAPLQSGIVRVFQQPGIETPSDEDDFIEVRSKRQMLNDRREQREKEIKAKSRVTKLPQKPRSNTRGTIGSASSKKGSVSANEEAVKTVRSNFVSKARNLASIEGSAGFSTGMVSQPLAPIGTPAFKNDAQTVKSIQTSSLPTPPNGGTNLVSGFVFESKNKALDSIQTTLSSWGNSRINQQVMSLTQTQLDDAMKPLQFDSGASIGDSTSSVGEPTMPSSSILTKDKSFSSAASPVNSLLAGEKIQFGAVTSPTVLPPCSRTVSHGIGPPGPSLSEKQISRNISASENDCTLFFEKEKHSNESRIHLEDCEDEAEAAASAVAVAAITNDEIVGNRLDTCSVSASDTKSFGATDIDGVVGDQQIASQSKSEECLSVALPADLSVENPPISLWPPLPSPQNSSSQMISHFSGGPPSHFPFYEMNPMLGGPIFAFGAHEESAPTQPQLLKSNAPSSSPLGTWHSGVDSFYGPPAGFTGTFIGPPGGIPGVQGPPHMVVYKHFAPVGQFGQVGLSFMGTTYIPSGKQPDWKHNPVSSAMGVVEGDVSNMNMTSSQCNPTNMPAPVQHLASGSSLLPMASPLVFDVSPFQSSPVMSVPARWSHVPASPLQSMPLQQHAEGAIPSQFNQGPSVDQSLTSNKFLEPQSSTPSDGSLKFPLAAAATVSQLPDELGLVEPSSSIFVGASTQSIAAKSSSLSEVSDTSTSKKTDVQNGNGSNSSGQHTSSAFKTNSSQQKNVSSQYGNSSGYNHQRGGGVSQKNNSGEWSHRRTAFQGRNQSFGGDKNFSSSKMKQIYVAKQQPTSGTGT
ncbi:hypothetical protein SLE2022_362290 [Rubroshorea leprosula]